MGGTPYCPWPLVSMMVCKGHLGTSSWEVNIRDITCLRELGGHALCGGGSNGLDQWLGPTPRKCGQAHDSVVQQDFDLFWNDTPLESVKGCNMLPLVPGRSCECGRKGALKALIPHVGCRA
jgi:hypothetical protein